jgi:hypothetical protein
MATTTTAMSDTFCTDAQAAALLAPALKTIEDLRTTTGRGGYFRAGSALGSGLQSLS